MDYSIRLPIDAVVAWKFYLSFSLAAAVGNRYPYPGKAREKCEVHVSIT
jgi:hypothetical protein